MSFRDRSPIRNGGRFRPDARPGPPPGFGGRINDRLRMDDRPPLDDRSSRLDDRPSRFDDRPSRFDDRPPRLDDRAPRLEDRPGRIDDRGPRPDWRDRERFDDRAGRGGPVDYGRPGGLLDLPPRAGPDYGRGAAPDLVRGTTEYGRGNASVDFPRPGVGPSSDFRDVGPVGDFNRGPSSGEFGRGAPPVDIRGSGGSALRDGPLPLDVRGGLRDAVQRNVPERDGAHPASGGRGPPIESSRWADSSAKLPMADGPQPAPNGRRTNDCEIIVTHKSLTGYAEFIERRLKKLGLSVDLLFPNEEVPLGRVLANIASRGTLYAVVVTTISEEHRSVTVNILYGQTQEHRNIPLEDGLQLIVRNFEAYVRGDKAPPVVAAPGGIPVNPAGVPLGAKHPEIIHTLLLTLVDNKPLTVLQYEKLISYLQEKREMQLKLEVGDVNADGGDTHKTLHLQNRILDLLKSSDAKSDKLGGNQHHNDPQPLSKETNTLQKAIENIVQNNMYKTHSQSAASAPRGYGSSYMPRK